VACADQAIAICEKHGFDTRIGNVLQHRSPALFERGDKESGLADIEQGLTLWRQRNGTFFLARNLAKLAEYQLRAGRLEPARASLAETEHLTETSDEKMYLAEIVRLRGQLRQSEERRDEAKECFKRAIGLARDQQARLFELNAARDLVLLTADSGDCAEAIELLRTVVDWFPAVLEVPVLAQCRAVLRQTAAGRQNLD
jgi:tetratricopeptide (TPR) repeat protein